MSKPNVEGINFPGFPPFSQPPPLGGPLCDSQEQYEEAVGRNAAIPLYVCCTNEDLLRRSVGYVPGRVVCQTSCRRGLLRSDIGELACTQDVLFARLYAGQRFPGGTQGKEWNRLQCYDANMRVLPELGPQFRAVLIGNAGPESTFIGRIAKGTDQEKSDSVDNCVEFVSATGEKLRSIGARPAFGFTLDQILIHAYWAERNRSQGDPLIKVLRELDALIVCFLGFAFYGIADETMLALEHDPGELILKKADLDEPPYPQLQSWIEQVEAWGGMDYMAGLRRKNDVLLRDGGWKGGVIGELPPTDILQSTPRDSAPAEATPLPSNTEAKATSTPQKSQKPKVQIPPQRSRPKPGNRPPSPNTAYPGARRTTSLRGHALCRF